MGCHSGCGTMAATMVNPVLSTDVCFVLDLYGRILPRGKTYKNHIHSNAHGLEEWGVNRFPANEVPSVCCVTSFLRIVFSAKGILQTD